MRKHVANVVILVGALLLCATEAGAWSREGHRKVCLTAWTELSENSLKQVRSLLDIETAEQFADLCYWAEEVRRSRRATASWHYVNIPKDARRIEYARDCPEPKSCVVEQVELKAMTLKIGGTKKERAEALKFLAHFVADMHQPLNVGFAEDDRGSDIKVTFLGKKTNMHDVWDVGLSEAPPPGGVAYRAAPAHERARWRSGTVQDWGQETVQLMRADATGYVGNPGGLELGEDFVEQNYRVAAQQIEKAGVRLGVILEATLKAYR